MKRENGKIVYHETGRYHINDLTETYYYDFFDIGRSSEVKVLHLSSYQIVNVYTDKDTPMEAYLKLNGLSADYQVAMDDESCRYNHRSTKAVLGHIKHNNSFNCHGYSFLDGVLWMELHNEKLQTILADDGYQECSRSELKENGVALYFDEDNKIFHSGRMIDGQIESKFGINRRITKGEKELYDRYKYVAKEYTKYYNVNPKRPGFIKRVLDK